MICSAAGWVAVFGTDPDTATRRPLACWVAVTAPPFLPNAGPSTVDVYGLVAEGARLTAAPGLPGFTGYEYTQ